MALVRCDVKAGLRDSEATAIVKTAGDRYEFIPVDRDFLSQEGNAWYLPVMLLRSEEQNGVALIQLPVEADSGANRLWVDLSSISHGSEVPT